MIQQESMVKVADNSGAKRALVIRVLGGTRRRYAGLGDVVIVAVKDALPNGTGKKPDVARAGGVRTAQETRRKEGRYVRVDENGLAILQEQAEARRSAMHVSNVMLIDPKSGEPTRTRMRLDEDGTKERLSVKSGDAIPKPAR